MTTSHGRVKHAMEKNMTVAKSRKLAIDVPGKRLDQLNAI